MPWAKIVDEVVLVQNTRKLCVLKDLSAHDIVMRLMRKENYLIGMLNKGVLAFPISQWFPGTGPTVQSSPDGAQYRLVLTKTLEWTLNWCILHSMFDRYVNFCTNAFSCTIRVFNIICSCKLLIMCMNYCLLRCIRPIFPFNHLVKSVCLFV